MASYTLIHLSDLHIGLRAQESKRTTEIFGWISSTYPGTPVLITGDLTDSAKKSQFKKTRGLLDELAKTNPILTVPGNHDYAWKGNILRSDGWKNWTQILGSPLGWNRDEVYWLSKDHVPAGVEGVGLWLDGNIAFFGVDSGDPMDKQISARGYISRGLANILSNSLKKHKDKTRIVFLHHHPFTEGFFIKLHGANRLMNAVRDNCELLLFGHNHEYGIWWDQKGVKSMVSSHKSTDELSGNVLMVTIIDIEKAGTKNVSFRHRLETI